MFFNASNSYDPDEDDRIVSYLWDFGDGTSGSGITVEHIYSKAGNFSVTLTVIDSHDEQTTTTKVVNIVEKNKIESSNSGNGKWVIPGFEVFLVFLAVFIDLFRRKLKN